MQTETLSLMKELSDLTQTIGRRIGSTKNTVEDVDSLIRSLEQVTDALVRIKHIMLDENSQELQGL